MDFEALAMSPEAFDKWVNEVKTTAPELTSEEFDTLLATEHVGRKVTLRPIWPSSQRLKASMQDTITDRTMQPLRDQTQALRHEPYWNGAFGYRPYEYESFGYGSRCDEQFRAGS